MPARLTPTHQPPVLAELLSREYRRPRLSATESLGSISDRSGGRLSAVPVGVPGQAAVVFGGAWFVLAAGEGVVEVADGGGVVLVDRHEGKDVAIGVVQAVVELPVGDRDVKRSAPATRPLTSMNSRRPSPARVSMS